jgi:hypothetical protein
MFTVSPSADYISDAQLSNPSTKLERLRSDASIEVIVMENTTTKNTVSSQPVRNPRVEPVYCPICTHTVPAEVIWSGKRVIVRPGQKCARCHSQLDAGYIMRTDQAA